jgi:hypothetical protein
LAIVDRLLLVWLHRLFPSVLSAITIVQPETIIRVASDRFPAVLALEGALSWRSTKGSNVGARMRQRRALLGMSQNRGG